MTPEIWILVGGFAGMYLSAWISGMTTGRWVAIIYIDPQSAALVPKILPFVTRSFLTKKGAEKYVKTVDTTGALRVTLDYVRSPW
jgi:hypothetical protein